ncbi:MAG TPA: hypothetical protein VML00_03005 [Bacteroidota bacterium]|nr:hypothetical protein [Bacteroidota bacterium]
MSDRSVNGYTIRVTHVESLGSPWVVRVYRRRFLFRTNVSSDWFLDREQALRFAEQAAAELGAGKGAVTLRSRKPGWTLDQPGH